MKIIDRAISPRMERANPIMIINTGCDTDSVQCWCQFFSICKSIIQICSEGPLENNSTYFTHLTNFIYFNFFFITMQNYDFYNTEKFDFVEWLGEGTFAEVWKIKDHKKNVYMALKMIDPYIMMRNDLIHAEINFLKNLKHVSKILLFHHNFSSVNIIRSLLSLSSVGKYTIIVIVCVWVVLKAVS